MESWLEFWKIRVPWILHENGIECEGGSLLAFSLVPVWYPRSPPQGSILRSSQPCSLCPLNPRYVFWTSWWWSDSRPRGQSAWAACSSTRTQRSLRARSARWKPVPIVLTWRFTTLLGIKRWRPVIEHSGCGPLKGFVHRKGPVIQFILLLNMPALGGDWKVLEHAGGNVTSTLNHVSV